MGQTPESDTACTGWDNGTCTGTPHCPPRCPRFFDAEGDPVLITPFEDADFAALVSMYAAFPAGERTSSLPPPTRDAIVDWLGLITEDGWNLLARIDDRVVGHAAVTPAAADTPEFVIFVDDAYQGRGIGTEMVKQLVAYAAADGHEALCLSVERTNERAISVYENISFEITDEAMATIAMRLSLDKPIAEDVQRSPAKR